MRLIGPRSRSVPKLLLIFSAIIFTALALLLLNLGSIDLSLPPTNSRLYSDDSLKSHPQLITLPKSNETASSTCATVEEMGKGAAAFNDVSRKESLRVRRLIRDHFAINGASRIRNLPPKLFCRQGFVMGKASEEGFGNEMYKILTAAGLSIMLNRSFIIGQTRGKFPFDDYVSYTKHSFTLKEVKHLWRKNDCLGKYKRSLIMRIDNFEKPSETNVLCSNWGRWKQPIIWFQGTTDAVASQFFLKNIHHQMRDVASALYGNSELLSSRPNTIGELMKVIIIPSEAVNWALRGGPDPDLSLHMRMLRTRPVRAVTAALNCIKEALASNSLHVSSRPRVVLLSDTPSLISDIIPQVQIFAEVLILTTRGLKVILRVGKHLRIRR